MTRIACKALSWLLLTLAAIAATPLLAQQYPSRPITIIVPFPPAGIIDTLARLVGGELTKRWGQPVVVENRPGAGGWIGVQQFSRMAPDGYALMSGASAQATGELFLKNASFEPGKDVQPVAGVAYAPYVIITSTQVPAKTLKDFIALVKSQPGKLNFVVVPGSGQLLDTMDFMKRAGMDMVIVPYQGGAAALRAVLANEGQAYFGAVLGLEQNVQAGKLTALAVTSARPSPVLPDVPTVKSVTGIDFDAGVLYGLFTVPGTPSAIVQKLYHEIVDIALNTEVGTALRKQSYEIKPTSPEDYAALLNNELRRGRELAKAANIQPQGVKAMAANPCVQFDGYKDRYRHINMERHDGILQLTFHKDGGPFRMCALAHAECCDAFYQVGADHENKIVILTGTGDVFCTHWDRDFEHGSGDALAKIHWEGRKILQHMLDIEALMISAINGPSFVHCFPVATDIVLCTDDTVFQDQHISDIGVVVGDGANIVWQYLMGPTRGKYFLLTGEELPADEAKRIGIVNEILPREKLLPRAWELARNLAKRPHTALRYSRLVLNQQWRRFLLDDLAFSYGMQQLGAATTRDANWGRKAFPTG